MQLAPRYTARSVWQRFYPKLPSAARCATTRFIRVSWIARTHTHKICPIIHVPVCMFLFTQYAAVCVFTPGWPDVPFLTGLSQFCALYPAVLRKKIRGREFYKFVFFHYHKFLKSTQTYIRKKIECLEWCFRMTRIFPSHNWYCNSHFCA